MGKKVLVVDDEKLIVKGLRFSLEQDDMEVDCAYDGEEALEYARSKEYDIVLLDVMLPGKDGFELMDLMKEAKIPVIYLTAKSDVGSKIRGLRSGAEDYIVKPFEVLELLVRVEKVLERTGRQISRITVGDIEINLNEHQVTKNGQEVSLKPLEYDLLVLLAKNKNMAFTREQLLNQVWGSDYLGETRTVDVHIGQLRKKLELFDVIKTIPKIGYRLED